jgi:predicted permease
VNLLRGMAPATLPRADELQLDGIALLVTAAIALIIAFVFSLLPTLYARRTNLATDLKSDARGAAGSRRQRTVRSALIVSELAMATTLTVCAALLIKSLWTLQNVDPGFNASQVLKAEFQLPDSRYPRDFSRFPDWPERARFANEVMSRLTEAPGVVSVAMATANPMDAGSTSSIRVVGREAEAEDWPEPSVRIVSAEYFSTMQVPLSDGRAFSRSDDASAPPVMMINEAARARFFGEREALSARVFLWGREWTVVGVAGNERIKGLATDAPPSVYLPLGQAPTPSTILVRTTGDAKLLAPLVRQVVREVDPELALFGVEPLTETIQGTMMQRRFTALVLATFASVALLLAAVGVHGVLSYTVAQRTREIGIRVALGADFSTIRRLVLGDGARLTAIGVSAGIAGAFVLSRAMQSLLYEASLFDPTIFALVAVLLTAVAMAACWFPSRRAARMDPMLALRQD